MLNQQFNLTGSVKSLVKSYKNEQVIYKIKILTKKINKLISFCIKTTSDLKTKELREARNKEIIII